MVGPAYDVREVVAEALRLQPQREIALKLDVEGGEFSILDALMEPLEPLASPPQPPLLCNVSISSLSTTTCTPICPNVWPN